MRDYKKSVKLTYIIINISILVLFLLAVTLPWAITWYVEVKHRNPNLPTVVMLTCYPCLPFAAVALFSLRKLLKNILNGLVFGDSNLSCCKKVSVCAAVGGFITFIAGFYYLPFFVVSIASFGCAIIVKAIKDVFAAELETRREELYNSVRDEL